MNQHAASLPQQACAAGAPGSWHGFAWLQQASLHADPKFGDGGHACRHLAAGQASIIRRMLRLLSFQQALRLATSPSETAPGVTCAASMRGRGRRQRAWWHPAVRAPACAEHQRTWGCTACSRCRGCPPEASLPRPAGPYTCTMPPAALSSITDSAADALSTASTDSPWALLPLAAWSTGAGTTVGCTQCKHVRRDAPKHEHRSGQLIPSSYDMHVLLIASMHGNGQAMITWRAAVH